jgi:hypothetical protein
MDLADGLNFENTPPLAVPSDAARGRGKRHVVHGDCLNCGTKLEGEYCHACGQLGHVHRSVLHVIEEVFYGITHFDSRTWRSLPMLAFRPGTLTRNYVMGQRARYVAPFAMFLFSIFAMFLVFAFSGGPNLVTKEEVSKAERVQNARELVQERQSDLEDARSEVADAEKELADLRAATDTEPGEIGAATGQLGGARGQLASAQRRLSEANAALATAIAAPEQAPPATKAKASGPAASITFDSSQEKAKVLSALSEAQAKAKQEGNGVAASVIDATAKIADEGAVAQPKKAGSSATLPKEPNTKSDVEINFGEDDEDIMTMLKDSMRRGEFIVTPWPELNKKINHKTENPDLFVYKLQNTAYKFSFLLVPLSLPFIWIMLFWKKNVKMFDHAVFSLYSLSFVSFLFMMVSLGAHWLPLGQVFGLAALIMPIHIFFQFKGAYQLKWFSAFWRTALFCSVSAWTIILAFLLSIIALGVTG